jgi:hypothetical protein
MTRMTRHLNSMLYALMFVAASGAYAQTPPSGAGNRPPQGAPAFDCSKAPDPAQCEARRKQMRERFEQARAACEGKQGSERGECMAQSICAKAPDPQICTARAAERRKAMQACAGKQGDEIRGCMKSRREARPAPRT